MNPIKVALIEDNNDLREGLQLLINSNIDFKCVGAWPDATDILLRIRCTLPQVILMDIEMPGKINGIEATKLIKAEFPDIRVIMQTVFEDNDKIFQSITAGASGYLIKNKHLSHLFDAIKEVIDGGAPMTPSIAYKTLEMFRRATGIPHASYAKTSVSVLTDRQQEVLEAIVKGKSYKLIAEEFNISLDTVKYHVKNIYELLQVSSRFELTEKFRK